MGSGKMTAILLSVVLSASGISAAAESLPAIKVKVLQQEVQFPDQLPIIAGNRTLVPIRPIAESLGFNVDYADRTSTVHFRKGETSVKLIVNQKLAYRNGDTIELDTPAQIINERTMVPIRFIAEAFDYNVNWDNNNRQVLISRAQQGPQPQPAQTDPVQSTQVKNDGHPSAAIQLGDEVLFSKFHGLIAGKRIGLVTNQTGINSNGISLIKQLYDDPDVKLTALFGPEHGIDGKASAGTYVQSYTHPEYHIPVYSLYGETRTPTQEMLENVDVLLFDVQDVGARWYTYMSTLNYCMNAAKKYNKQVIVLDRPNPLGGKTVEGPIAEDAFLTFVGVDNLPMAHGMTAGELALFYNRKIGVNLTVVPMEGYTRDMIFQDTGLKWIASSPMMPDIESVFGYMATGLGEGTGVFQSHFQWVGSVGLDSDKFAELLNAAHLSGVQFIPETRGSAGGVKLKVTDYHLFNPAKTGIYALAYAHLLTNFEVPKSGKTVVMFDKIMGTDKMGEYLQEGLTPQQMEAKYAQELDSFKKMREHYLIYNDQPYHVTAPVTSN